MTVWKFWAALNFDLKNVNRSESKENPTVLAESPHREGIAKSGYLISEMFKRVAKI
jgi:hypothetical protein